MKKQKQNKTLVVKMLFELWFICYMYNVWGRLMLGDLTVIALHVINKVEFPRVGWQIGLRISYFRILGLMHDG